jgi:hypothetical protein
LATICMREGDNDGARKQFKDALNSAGHRRSAGRGHHVASAGIDRFRRGQVR